MYCILLCRVVCILLCPALYSMVRGAGSVLNCMYCIASVVPCALHCILWYGVYPMVSLVLYFIFSCIFFCMAWRLVWSVWYGIVRIVRIVRYVLQGIACSSSRAAFCNAWWAFWWWNYFLRSSLTSPGAGGGCFLSPYHSLLGRRVAPCNAIPYYSIHTIKQTTK